MPNQFLTFAGDPAAIVVGRSNLAVECQRGFERDQRAAGTHEMHEVFVELFGLGHKFLRRLYRDTGGAQLAKSLAGHLRIGIGHGGDHPAHTRGNERIGARSGSALV